MPLSVEADGKEERGKGVSQETCLVVFICKAFEEREQVCGESCFDLGVMIHIGRLSQLLCFFESKAFLFLEEGSLCLSR